MKVESNKKVTSLKGGKSIKVKKVVEPLKEDAKKI